MMKRAVLLMLGVFFITLSNAQSKREWLEYGDEEFEKGNYASAVYYYLKILGKGGEKSKDVTYPYEVRDWIAPAGDDSSATSGTDERYSHVVHKVADSYRLNSDYDNAEIWYAEAVLFQEPNPAYPFSRYWYAMALMSNEKYTEAEVQFETFLEENVELTASSQEATEFQRLAQNGIVSVHYAQDPQNFHDDKQVTKMDTTVNAGTTAFAASYYGNDILVSSARPESTVGENKDLDPNYVADLFVIGKDGTTQQLPFPINTADNEGAGALSVDRTTLYFTRWTYGEPNECAIYVSKFFNGQWLQPLRLDNKVNAVGYKSMHPTLNLDETKLYFSSNRPGGQGGMDIWYCEIDEYGQLGEPVNMGTNVNTAGDEITPFYHYQSNTIYFSSNGRPGYGGQDIFRSTLEINWPDTTWLPAVNIGAPFNSARDDAYFVLDREQRSGYLSSDREKCSDCIVEDELIGTGYCYKVYEITQPEMVFSLDGYVYDAETEEVIPGALLTFKDVRGGRDDVFIVTDADGYYYTDLEVGWDLFIKAQKNKYFGDAAAISTVGKTESEHFIQDFYLTPIPEGEIEIPGIEYDFDGYGLRPKSKEILDDLVEFLELNDNLVVEIGSHTDVRGSEEYNQTLSENRAKSVVNYLIANGIDEDRLFATGYGETDLLIEDAQTEEEHQRNRRTTFKVLKEGGISVLESSEGSTDPGETEND